jgi:1,4-alpha-glucan branching enzyme
MRLRARTTIGSRGGLEMSKKKQEKKTQKKRITFKLEASEAKEAILVGDFNSWDLKKHTMKKDNKGRWTKIVTLAPGGWAMAE